MRQTVNIKTIYRNRRTKRLCRRSDPEAEALVVPAKRVRLVGGRLYHFEMGKHYTVEHGQPYELIRDGGQLLAVPLKPVLWRELEPAPLFEQEAER